VKRTSTLIASTPGTVVQRGTVGDEAGTLSEPFLRVREKARSWDAEAGRKQELMIPWLAPALKAQNNSFWE
jgi:hypothetical protein